MKIQNAKVISYNITIDSLFLLYPLPKFIIVSGKDVAPKALSYDRP